MFSPCVGSLFCCVVLGVITRRADCVSLIVLWLSVFSVSSSWCNNWSEVCECSITGHTHFFLLNEAKSVDTVDHFFIWIYPYQMS